MLSSFLLWLSIGGLYDIPLLSYATSSGNDGKPLLGIQQEGNQFGDTLPVGTYEDWKGRLKLEIKEKNKCRLLVNFPGGWWQMSLAANVREEYKGYNCYRDPADSQKQAIREARNFLGFGKNALKVSLILICHSTDGRVWIRGPSDTDITLTLQKQSKEKVQQRKRAGESLHAQHDITQQHAKAVNKQQYGIKSTKKTNGNKPAHLSGSLGDGEDISARAMYESGINTRRSLKYGETPIPQKARRLSQNPSISAKGTTGAEKGTHASSRSEEMAASELVSATSADEDKLDYSMPSTSGIDKDRSKEIEAGSRTGGNSEAGSPPNKIEPAEFDEMELDGLIRELDEEGIVADLPPPDNESNMDDIFSSDDPQSPLFGELTFDDLLQSWED